MISIFDLQQKYMDFYKYFRNYIWNFPTIEHLADLEMCIFSAFPDIVQARNLLKLLNYDMKDGMKDSDPDLDEAYQELSDAVNESDETYYKLTQVNEV